MDWLCGFQRVDPDRSRDLWRFGAHADKPLRGAEKRGVKRVLAGGVDCVGRPKVDLVGRHQADTCVMMVFVIPGEEAAAKCAGLVDRP